MIKKIFALAALAVAQETPVPIDSEEELRYYVKFNKGRKANVVAALAAQGGNINYDFNSHNVMVVSVPNLNALQALANNPNVELVEEDTKVYASADNFPYGLNNIGATGVLDTNGDGQVDGGAPTGAGKTVCVIDSGLESGHEDFAGGSGTVDGYGDWEYDGCDHGTHCAGTVAARANGVGVVGVAPDANLYIVKVFARSRCSWSWGSSVANAAQICRDNGADIVSMSLGGGGASNTENTIFSSLFNNDGVISVAAAGNGGSSTSSYPASYNDVVSVACTDNNNNHVYFSQYNAAVDIAAPGYNTYSTIPFSSYGYKSGTSMSTPHVAGALAAAWSVYPTASAQEVRACLYSSALDLGATGRDNYYGHGLVQLPALITCIGATQSTPGDGQCTGNENCETVPQDCGACSCGDGQCTASESCSSCPGDCGDCPACNDGTCDAGEDCSSCSSDCGACCDASCDSCVAGQCFCASGYVLSAGVCVQEACDSCLTQGCSSSADCCGGLTCYTCGRGKKGYNVCLRTGASYCDDCPAGASDDGPGKSSGKGVSAGLSSIMAGAGLLLGGMGATLYHRRKVRQATPDLDQEETFVDALAQSVRDQDVEAVAEL